MTLEELNLNDYVTIVNVSGDLTIKRRLLDLGFIPGEEVKCVLVSPFHDPKADLVHGNVIALRGVDAKNVEVVK